MMTLSTILTFLSLPFLSYAHMQMSWPYPINSPLDPQVPEESKDYDYTSPLLASGANFPCKGFQTQTPIRTTATYQAGQRYNMSIAGGAQHGGGSCQLSLSYDNGETFKVIKSMIGGCPITLTYDFTVPDFAPSGTALLAWTWFNLIGNREMYMDCAWVDVVGASPGRHRRAQYKRQQSMDSLPDIFVANVNQPSQCASIEGEDVVFPNPGNVVVHGTDSIPHSQTGDGFTCSGALLNSPGVFAPSASPSSTSINQTTDSPSTSSTASTTSMPLSLTTMTSSMNTPSTPTAPLSNSTTMIPSTTSASNGTAASSKAITSTTSHTVTVTAQPTPSSSSISSVLPTTSASGSPTTSSSSLPSITAIPSTCTPGTFACNSATAFSMCSAQGDGYIYMGSVAAGTTCKNGSISRINDGPCAPDGSIQCDSTGHVFFECYEGGLIDMGSTAAGTLCANGKIVAG